MIFLKICMFINICLSDSDDTESLECLFLKEIKSISTECNKNIEKSKKKNFEENSLNELFIFTLDQNDRKYILEMRNFMSVIYSEYKKICGDKQTYICAINRKKMKKGLYFRVNILHLFQTINYLRVECNKEKYVYDFSIDSIIDFKVNNSNTNDDQIFQQIANNIKIFIVDNCSTKTEQIVFFYKIAKLTFKNGFFQDKSNYYFFNLKFNNQEQKKKWNKFILGKIHTKVLMHKKIVIGSFYFYSTLHFDPKYNLIHGHSLIHATGQLLKQGDNLKFKINLKSTAQENHAKYHQEILKGNMFGCINTIIAEEPKNKLITLKNIFKEFRYYIKINALEGNYNLHFCTIVYKYKNWHLSNSKDRFTVIVSIYRIFNDQTKFFQRFTYNLPTKNKQTKKEVSTINKHENLLFEKGTGFEFFLTFFKNLISLNVISYNFDIPYFNIFYKMNDYNSPRQICTNFDLKSNQGCYLNSYRSFFKNLTDLNFEEKHIHIFHATVNKKKINQMVKKVGNTSIIKTLEIDPLELKIEDILENIENFKTLVINIDFLHNNLFKKFTIILPINEIEYLSHISTSKDRIFLIKRASDIINKSSLTNIVCKEYLKKVINHIVYFDGAFNHLNFIGLGIDGDDFTRVKFYFAMIRYLDLIQNIMDKELNVLHKKRVQNLFCKAFDVNVKINDSKMTKIYDILDESRVFSVLKYVLIQIISCMRLEYLAHIEIQYPTLQERFYLLYDDNLFYDFDLFFKIHIALNKIETSFIS